jgi:molybdate transport system substrate-binding protein
MRFGWGLLLAFGMMAANAKADPIRIYAAGSLGGVMPKLIAASGLPPDSVAPPVFGPAGMLGKRLLAGEKADLFASADLAQPRAVVGESGALVVPFARNRMCVVAPAKLGLTADNLLPRMLAPDTRLATSTPGADPAGDYTLKLFARAEALHQGAEAALKAKALRLVGGPESMQPLPGHSPAATVFLGDHADMLIYYCSGAAVALQEVPGLVSIPVPDALEVGPIYGLAILSDRPEAAHLALFILSEKGQAIIAQGGLLPVVAER